MLNLLCFRRQSFTDDQYGIFKAKVEMSGDRALTGVAASWVKYHHHVPLLYRTQAGRLLLLK